MTLPENILSIIQSSEEIYYTYPPPNKKGKWESKPIRIPVPLDIEFFFVVSDVSELVVTVKLYIERTFNEFS